MLIFKKLEILNLSYNHFRSIDILEYVDLRDLIKIILGLMVLSLVKFNKLELLDLDLNYIYDYKYF